MDKTVTAKFFQIQAGRGSNGHPLIEHLRSLNASQLDDRIRLVNDVPHWVDKVEVSAAVASGRFCRKQSTNLPPKALDRAELVPLGIKEIGQTVAWRYDSKLSVLAIETSRSGLSVNRLLLYVRMICDCRGYGAFPVVTDTNLELAREGRIRELSLQLATPRDLRSVAPYQQAVSHGMNTLMSQDLSSMLEIRYSLRVGEPDIPFTGFERMVRWLKGEHDNERGDIKKIQARIIDKEGEALDLDLLDVHLHEKRDLVLPDDDPDMSYDARKAFLTSAFNKHGQTLSDQFGS